MPHESSSFVNSSLCPANELCFRAGQRADVTGVGNADIPLFFTFAGIQHHQDQVCRSSHSNNLGVRVTLAGVDARTRYQPAFHGLSPEQRLQ